LNQQPPSDITPVIPADTTSPVITDYTIQASVPPGAGLPRYSIPLDFINLESLPTGQSLPLNPITVNVGDTVTMTNNSQYGAQHTFSSDGMFDSGTLNPGQSFEWVPQTAGIHNFYCKIFPYMVGTITVESALETPTPATPTPEPPSGFSIVIERPNEGNPEYKIFAEINQSTNFVNLKSFTLSKNNPNDVLQNIFAEVNEPYNIAQDKLMIIQESNRYNSDGTETNEYIQSWITLRAYSDVQTMINEIIYLHDAGMSLDSTFVQLKPYYSNNVQVPEPTVEEFNVTATEKVIVGDLLKIDIVASHKTSIEIEIVDLEGNEMQKLSCITTKEFKCESFWSIPKDTIPGTYTIKAFDTISSTEETFEIIKK
jgi:hypothetical protein